MAFVAVVGPCLVVRGPSGAFPEEVGAVEAFPVGARLVEAAAEEAFLAEVRPSAEEEAAAARRPCRAAGRTSLVLLRGRAPFADGAGSFAQLFTPSLRAPAVYSGGSGARAAARELRRRLRAAASRCVASHGPP